MWKLDKSCVPNTCLNFSIRFHSKDFNANFISLKGHTTSFFSIIGKEDKSYPSCRAQCQRQPRRGRRPWRCNTFKVVCEQLFPHRFGKQSSVEYSFRLVYNYVSLSVLWLAHPLGPNWAPWESTLQPLWKTSTCAPPFSGREYHCLQELLSMQIEATISLYTTPQVSTFWSRWKS